ncbi:MAG: hypothetical protein NC821_05355 [Candidatus Omnitrophica bacterium]|nr:hypothetical protein [Candidatus Omnitrophota bacterium]
MNLTGLDERVAEKVVQEFGIRIKGPIFNLPEEVVEFVFIIFAAIAGFILGYNFYRLFKTK